MYKRQEWQITPQENDGYYLRPVTQEEIAGDTIDSVSQPGWYYVLKRDLTFNMVLRVGTIPSTEESRKALLNKVLDNFRFTAFWNVGDEQKTQISILRTMESYVPVSYTHLPGRSCGWLPGAVPSPQRPCAPAAD